MKSRFVAFVVMAASLLLSFGAGCGGRMYAPVVRSTFTCHSPPREGCAMVFTNCSPEVRGNSVRYCRSNGSAAVATAAAGPVFVDDAFTDNKSGLPGVVRASFGSAPHFSRCIVARNHVNGNSGAFMSCDSSTLYVDSCSIGENGAAGVYVQQGADAFTTNSSINGNLGYGVNSVREQPRLSYHVQTVPAVVFVK
jgi:hypothetical protein